MNKSIFGLAALILASPAFSGEPRINSTRDSGGYEATLRQSGIPLSGGLAWSAHSAPLAAPAVPTRNRIASSPAVVAKTARES